MESQVQIIFQPIILFVFVGMIGTGTHVESEVHNIAPRQTTTIQSINSSWTITEYRALERSVVSDLDVAILIQKYEYMNRMLTIFFSLMCNMSRKVIPSETHPYI